MGDTNSLLMQRRKPHIIFEFILQLFNSGQTTSRFQLEKIIER